MAKDAAEKPVSSSNSDNNSPPTSDQQRVPPLRIVLNVSSNQKSSSASGTGSNNQHDSKRDKSNADTKTESSTVKPGGKVRIKLGTGKPANRNNSSAESQDKTPDESQKSRSAKDQDNSATKDDTSINYSHLRRITRRSQRTVQTISNEDEESISSMTSIDENQISNSNNSSNLVTNSDSNGASQDCPPTTSAPTSTAATGSTNCGTASTSADTPRRKRKKGESSIETALIDYESTFNFQNYRISVQNSFELFRNIRRHVDKKLKTLSSVHPRAPHGFKDYMLTRGAYLLDGNKLGNGTNLFMNEDGGLSPAPMGKYHLLRHNRVNYTVPNRAKVPLGLPVNSPLYNLFIEQEKERYRTQIQHIKEREKLTLAVEQEMMRVYIQAAMAAANQDEPFSACTMLKHQEIYNYLDSDGMAILASEDARLDQVKPSEGVRTRRRQHEHITSPTRETSKTSTSQNVAQRAVPDQIATAKDVSSNNESDKNPTAASEDVTRKSPPNKLPDNPCDVAPADNDSKSSTEESDVTQRPPKAVSDDSKVQPQDPDKGSVSDPDAGDKGANSQEAGERVQDEAGVSGSARDSDASLKPDPNIEARDIDPKTDAEVQVNSDKSREPDEHNDKTDSYGGVENEIKEQTSAVSVPNPDELDKGAPTVAMDIDNEYKATQQAADERVLTEEDVKAYNKEVFLSQLQVIDDKWEQVRAEMFIRHRNEAESLYAVQKLEWEWKTKEIGACDIRMTPIIDETLVPKLNIYHQDY